MIVVVGSPVAVRDPLGGPGGVGGMAARIAVVAAGAGSQVQVVGKAGEDAAGDQVILGLAAASVGHVALLRDPANPTPLRTTASAAGESPAVDDAPRTEPEAGLPLEPADIDLALRYLPDYRVLVVADDLDDDAARIVAEAASWSGATLVLVVPAGQGPGLAASDSTVLFERPDGGDADGTFAEFVGQFAAAVDGGASTEEALRRVTGRFGAS